jgi:hypothetical protein
MVRILVPQVLTAPTDAVDAALLGIGRIPGRNVSTLLRDGRLVTWSPGHSFLVAHLRAPKPELRFAADLQAPGVHTHVVALNTVLVDSSVAVVVDAVTAHLVGRGLDPWRALVAGIAGRVTVTVSVNITINVTVTVNVTVGRVERSIWA